MPDLFRTLANGSRPPVIVVDVRGGRIQRDFRDLFSEVDLQVPVHELIPMADEPDWAGAATPGAAYLAPYLDEAVAKGIGPLSVFGFCAGTNLAVSLASGALARGREVAMLGLFDSSVLGPDDVVDEYRRIRHNLREGTGEAVDPVVAEARLLLETEPIRARDLLLEDLRQQLAQVAAEDEELAAEPSLVDAISGRYRQWLTFMVASAHLEPAPFQGVVQVFEASGYPTQLPERLARPPAMHRFDVAHDDLLGDPAVRKVAMLELETAVRSAARG